MSSVVAIAGGTGHLGRAIVEELVKSGSYKVFIFARETNEEKAKEIGAEITAIDYSNVDAIVSTLEANKIDTLISTLGMGAGADAEFALIKAADKSSTTKRYIPSTWGIKYTPEVAAIFPMSHSKLSYLKTLEESTSLEYTAVINGYFMDYFVAPHVKTYLQAVTMILDIANNAAGIPGSGNVPVVFTYTFDIAAFVAKLLTLSKWEKESYIIGDKVTWNEFVALAEEAKGVKFDVKYDEMEKLSKGEVTELPGQPAVYPFFPKQMLQGMSAVFGVLFERGFFDLKPEKALNDVFPDIKTRKIKELVQEAWGKK